MTIMKRNVQIIKGKKHSEPPVSLIGQLYWREWFYTVGHATPNFHKMEGNPICKQVSPCLVPFKPQTAIAKFPKAARNCKDSLSIHKSSF